MLQYHILIFVFICIFRADSLSIGGAPNYIALCQSLSASYAQLWNTSFPYITGSSISLLQSGNVSVSIADIPNSLLRTGSNKGLLAIPFVAQPFTFIYNVPELTRHLNLSFELFGDMLLGDINTWNHPNLLARNPELSAKNISKPITHVLRTGGNAVTQSICYGLTALNTGWNATFGPGLQSWPTTKLNITWVGTSNSIFGTFAQSFSTPYSISVGQFPFFETIGFSKGIDYAGLYNTSDNDPIVYPDDSEEIISAIENTVWHLGYDLITSGYTANWPLVIWGSMIINTNTTGYNCDDYQKVLRFFRWIYTDDKAIEVIEQSGFYSPSQSQRDEIVQYLDSLTCNGEVILEIAANPDNILGKIIISSFYWLIVIGSVILLSTMNYNKPVAKVYAVILIAGLLLGGASMILWTLTPTTDAMCSARWWLMGLGMVIFSGGVFCRSYQLKKIHQMVKSGRYQKSKNLNHFKLLISCMGFIIIVELIILVALQLTNPFVSEIHITDTVNRLGQYHCENEIPFIWVGIQSGYLVFILFMGVYSMYSTWKISSSVDDTRINILMIFICLVTLAVADVIWGYNGADSDNKETSDSWWAVSLITIWAISMMCTVLIPKLVKLRKTASSTSQTNTKHPTGGGGSSL